MDWRNAVGSISFTVDRHAPTASGRGLAKANHDTSPLGDRPIDRSDADDVTRDQLCGEVNLFPACNRIDDPDISGGRCDLSARAYRARTIVD
jgi:hypothetical protein